MTLNEKLTTASRKSKHLVVDGGSIICRLCQEAISIDKNRVSSRVDQHLQSKEHEKNELKCPAKVQSTIRESLDKSVNISSRQSIFSMELTKALVASDIPLNKLEDSAFRSFLEKWTKQDIPHRSTLSKGYIEPLYQSTLEKIRIVVGDDDIFLVVDETTDLCNRFVANVLVGVLNGSPSKPMLLLTDFLPETNNMTINQLIIKSLNLLWPKQLLYEKLHLVISDQASYMIKALSNLKQAGMFPNLKHITCLAHALHRVAEKIREDNDEVNLFISKAKATLRKSSHRQQQFQIETELALPPIPVVTRWGTWLNSVKYYQENYTKIKNFFEGLQDKSSAIIMVKNLINSPSFQEKLYSLQNYIFLSEEITKLEKQSLSIEDQLNVLNTVKTKLGEGIYLEKLNNCLLKNPDFHDFTSKNANVDIRIKRKFAPLVSVDVERSFSVYKNILRDNRHSFKPETLTKLLCINYNSFLIQN